MSSFAVLANVVSIWRRQDLGEEMNVSRQAMAVCGEGFMPAAKRNEDM